tara:strand:+ start:16357 stop:16584 length:228 start_codon:yes stop_codon:yes gene_type:complete
MITVNNTKATEITKEAIRVYRKPLLEALDVDYTRAVEVNGDVSTIVASKQTLRDMTATADGKTVDELKAIVEGLA